ncbi:MAG: DUF6788 family protein [Acidimicrobiales bacterium]
MARTKSPTLADYERRYRKLAAELAQIGFIRSGSVAPRYNRCGKSGCHCHADPPQLHGPYFQWTAKVDGKTVNRRLTETQAEAYLEWIGNDRRLRALVSEMRALAEQATYLILERQDKDESRV